LVFSCDEALIPISQLPFLSSPSLRVLDLLQRLCDDRANSTYILSGRDRNTLLQWFGHLRAGLIAEHGFFTLDSCNAAAASSGNGSNGGPSQQWCSLRAEVDLSWKQRVIPIFQHFTERTPGSFFEDKETCLTWHFRSSEREFGQFRAQELRGLLDTTTFPATVSLGDRTLEVRPYGCNYTSVLKKLMNKHPEFDFLLYIGETVNIDFSHDPRVFCCSVGRGHTLSSCEDVMRLLRTLLSSSQDSVPPSKQRAFARNVY